MLHSINNEQRLYVMTAGAGYSCLGWEYADRIARGVIAWMRDNSDLSLSAAPGTPEHYAQYRALMDAGASYSARTGKRCPVELTSQLIGLEGRRVEVVDCDGETRRFQVGKSTGWMPIHLEIARRNSSGGPAVYGAPFKSVRVIR